MKTSTRIIIATLFILFATAFIFMDRVIPGVPVGMQFACYIISMLLAMTYIMSIPPKTQESKYRHSFNSPNWGYSYQDIEVQADRWEEERKVLKELNE